MLREELGNTSVFFDERQFNINPFKQKSNFNPGKNDAIMEFYSSRLEEEILFLDNISYCNLTKGERNALYSLRDDRSIIVKEADKGSGVVVWEREVYLAEARKKLDDKEVYQKLRGDVESRL